MRWYTNNACIKVEAHDNISYSKIEPKSRKTDGWMAYVAAQIAAGTDLVDSGKVNTGIALDCYTY